MDARGPGAPRTVPGPLRPLAALLTPLALVVTGQACVGCARPGPDLCRACQVGLRGPARRSDPTPCPPGLPPTYAAADYAGSAREAVVAFKEHGRTGLRRPLARALAASVAAALSDRATPTLSVLLVPVPSSPAATRSRDTAAVLELARASAAVLRTTGLGARCWPALRSARSRADQTGLNASGRAANLAGSMRVRGSRPPQVSYDPVARAVVVVDDVVTTGATLTEAARALRAGGLDVDACAVVAATRRRHPSTG